jgi:Zn-dependent protease
MSLRNYLDKLNRYFWFTREELTSFCIVVLGLSFIYSWDQWGVDRFDLALGFKNYLFAALLIAITVFIHHAGQRMMALKLGLRAEQRLWWHGIIIGLILVLVTDGKVKFLAATGTLAYMLPIHRLGAFRYGPNLTTIAKIVLAGPILNILFSALIKGLEWAGMLSPELGSQLFVLNIGFAAWNLLPIPPLDGIKVFFYSRLTYVFLAGSIISYVLLIYLLSFYSYITALLIGSIVWLVYYIFFESKVRAPKP